MTFSTVHVIGTSYKVTSLDQVSRIQWQSRSQIAPFLEQIRKVLGLNEIFFLQTCNRREFYLYISDCRISHSDLKERFIAALAMSLGHSLEGVNFYHYANDQAVCHLMRVAASLDSMVLGETEILKQIKDQSESSRRAGNMGTRLKALVDAALRTSKQVRHQTAITKNVVSMGSLAYRKSLDFLGKNKRRRVVLVGAGHFIQSILPTFTKSNDLELVFVNRTLPVALAAKYKGIALTLADFLAAPQPFDIIISATGAPNALFDAAWLDKATEGPVLAMDCALPRDFDLNVRDMERVVYMDLEEMNQVLESNRAAREAEIPKAEPIFAKAIGNLRNRWLEFDLASYHQEISCHYQEAGERALEYLLREEMPDLTDEEQEALRMWTNNLVGKLVRVPVLGLKGVARELGKHGVAAYTRGVAKGAELFRPEDTVKEGAII